MSNYRDPPLIPIIFLAFAAGMWLTVLFTKQSDYGDWKKLKEVCEENLPRNQECVMVALPPEKVPK